MASQLYIRALSEALTFLALVVFLAGVFLLVVVLPFGCFWLPFSLAP